MAETASPWPGPGGVSWATWDTASPWLAASAGHTTLDGGLCCGALELVVDASVDDVVGASVELVVDVLDDVDVDDVDVDEDEDEVDDEEDDVVGSVGRSDGTSTVDGPDGPFRTLAAAAVTPPTINAAATPRAASLRA
jgi:hypothetical protein